MHLMLESHPHVLDALDAAIARYHPETQDHSHRVEQVTVALGAELVPPLDPSEHEALPWSGRLHDLGKLGIAMSVLVKRGELDPTDWADMRRHPLVGSDLVRSVSVELEPIAAGIRSHHERWDGGGYPHGLAGGSIPRVGRVVAVADAFDAITNKRSYVARVRSVAEALDVLSPAAGRHFDPQVIDALERAATSGALAPDALREST